MFSSSSRRFIQNSIKNNNTNNIHKSWTRSKSTISTNLMSNAGLKATPATAKQMKMIQYSIIATGLVTLLSAAVPISQVDDFDSNITLCEYKNKLGGDVVMLGPTKEPGTGILFPHLCNALQFVGCGVRVKYGFVKVYAVGTYMDPIAMSAIKNQGSKAISEALLDPSYPRTIRIVMNRSLSIDKYTAAIVEALEPRMNGEDLDKLEEFKKLNPPIDLVEGAEMEMTIRGNTMLYKNSVGGVGQIESAIFCKALCDVYYGDDAVSPGHKEQVIKGVAAL